MTDKSFSVFPLSEEIITALNKLEYFHPTDVQCETIPKILENQDLLVKSQTGSGKTAAYSIPICEKIDWIENKPQALILTPTRELAVQVRDDITSIGRLKRIKAAAVYGKQPIAVQKTALKQKTHVVVGTPGRVLDHIEREYLLLHKIRFLVIDEADEMLNMGFIEQVESIIKKLPVERVTLLFSATIPEEVKKISDNYMNNAMYISIENEMVPTKRIQHYIYNVENYRKFALLKKVTIIENPESCIIFCRTKDRVDELEEQLYTNGYHCDKIHGGMRQEDRLDVMDDFRRGKFRYLVATDVAARGIDIESISLVINFDLPLDKQSYVHRTGRTGRAGESGKAISFVTPNEELKLKEIEEFIGFSLTELDEPTNEEIDKKRPAFENKMQSSPVRKTAKNEQLNENIMKLFFNGGKKKKLRAVDFVGTIARIEGVNAEDIGIITITDTATFVEILNGKGPVVLSAMKKTTIKGKQLKVYQAKK